ncbi:hypothetical protein [Spartinivicinus ruber]|uniref:hypothetical protein n=1 Tax=Spartinivicinus ruber TaxID=2683272 RepID=UPI0013D2A7D3|nr:hypothetical protein [Spartinivicinus ruber]
MKKSSTLFTFLIASVYSLYSTADSEINITYKQEKAITSNIEVVQNNNQANFIYCEQGENLVIVNSLKIQKFNINQPCELVIQKNNSVYTFHNNYIKHWTYDQDSLQEDETYYIKHQKLISVIKQNPPVRAFLDNNLNVYSFSPENGSISVTIYNLPKSSLTKFLISTTDTSALTLGHAKLTVNYLKTCVVNNNYKYACTKLSPKHKDNITLKLHEPLLNITDKNFSLLTRGKLWMSNYKNNYQLCSLEKNDKLLCVSNPHKKLDNVDYSTAIGDISNNQISYKTVSYNTTEKSIFLQSSQIEIPDTTGKTTKEKYQTAKIPNKPKTLLSIFKKKFTENYKNITLVDLTNSTSINDANKQLNGALNSSQVILVEGKPKFIKQLRPKAISVWAGANLLVAVKEADNIYHIRTLNYEEKKLNSDPEDYLNKAAINTNLTIKKLLNRIQHNKTN